MSAEAELRGYLKGDLDAIYRLDQLCFSSEFRFGRESMRAFAEADDAVTLIAETTGGEIAGFVIVQVERSWNIVRGYVVTLDVAEKRRRRGLAQTLLQEAERRAATAGALWMELHVFTGNEGAIRFYERSGYARTELKRRFYGGAGLDAFAYRKELGLS
ncbi:N-acetyltransferase [Tunturibacter psychrotolerans]|uniref:N-acetyltransferase n=1 Tax=Tunturiibacter psychrotolerans TaxID=3069686 RepID=A0AAU7ZWH4_9BACT